MKKYCAIDFAKLFFAIAIVTLHVSQENAVFRALSQYIARFGVPFFLTVSGFFLYAKLERQQGDKTVIRSWLLRLAKLFGIWLLIYSPIVVLKPLIGKHDAAGVVGLVQEIVFKAPAYLWYLPALMLAGVLLYAFRGKLKLFLIVGAILFVIGACGNTYIRILDIEECWTGYFNVFLTTRNGLFFAPVFVGIGAVLYKYREKRCRQSYLIAFAVCAAVVYAIEAMLVWNSGRVYEDCSFYFSLPVLTGCIVRLLCAAEGESKHAASCRMLSTWIYCGQFGFLTVSTAVFARVFAHAVPGWALWMTAVAAGVLAYLVISRFKIGRKLLKVLL